MSWMSLPKEYRTNESSFAILPIPYEKDVTFGKGARKGAHAIIEASKHLEYYDDQFDCEPFEKGIMLLDELQLNEKTPEEMVSTVSNAIPKNKFVISLGGDHSVTIGIVKGLEQQYEEFSVIQFDAHADFRDSWNGSSYNHACVAKQISKKHEVVLVGVRSMDIDEKKAINESKRVHLISAYDFTFEKIKEILPSLKEKVYITIDVDVFDPSFMRNTGTPEPGGLSWNNIIDSLQLIFKEKNVIGADIVEFAPNHNYEGEAYALSKLAYKLMALKSLKEVQI